MKRKTLPSVCPLDCPDRCALDVTVEGDQVLKLDGSKRSPLTAGYICAKVRNFKTRLDAPNRVLTPMRRTGPKGSGLYEPAGWDEAISAISARLRAIAAEHGPEAVLPYSYSGSNGLLTSQAMDERFWNRFGSSQIQRTFCAANTGAGWTSVFGDLPGSDPADLVNSDAIVLWGVNPSVSGIHLVPLVREAKRRGAFLAVIDPRRTPLARQADLHISLHPGSDVAIALAMVGVAIRENLWDREFVQKFCRGFDALATTAEEWTLERASALARVPAESIAALPRALARARAPYFRVGWGLERNRNGTDAVRSVLMFRAIVGKFGTLGAGAALSTTRGYRFALDKAQGTQLRKRPARSFNMSEIGRILDEARGPAIHALFVYNCNPLATAPAQTRFERALRRESLFTVVHEQLWTDTCDYADWVLPATTFLEHRELSRSYGGYAVQWADPVVAPRGDARSNHALFTALAKAMGFMEPELAVTEEALASEVLAGLGRRQVSLPELQRDRFVPLEPMRPFVDVLPSRGYVDLAGASPPRYRPFPADPQLPLVLITPASDEAISSTLFERLPPGTGRLSLAPSDAQARGLNAGDRVRAWNSLGEVCALLEIDKDLSPGTASMPKGLWRSATLNRWTANALIPDHVDELGGGACYNDARIEVELAGDAG
ncbi:MAG: molybdopterin-dependent oxidoreductase [Planctomycetes bacterium]|nr:molybdopterin-dependent oxidoreductase [Planctomycetota bacterium]